MKNSSVSGHGFVYLSVSSLFGSRRVNICLFLALLLFAPLSTLGTTGFDFDGDNRADISVFRPSDGVWHIYNSNRGYGGFGWGLAGDKPVAADYDGDGRSDIAIFSTGRLVGTEE